MTDSSQLSHADIRSTLNNMATYFSTSIDVHQRPRRTTWRKAHKLNAGRVRGRSYFGIEWHCVLVGPYLASVHRVLKRNSQQTAD